MHQSSQLRSRSPAPAKDSEFRVLPFAGSPDQQLHSLLNHLLQQYRDALGTDKSTFSHAGEQLELPLLMPSTRLPDEVIDAGGAQPWLKVGDVGPAPGICDLAFESLLNELVQQHQDAFRNERFAFQDSSQETQAPWPVLSSLIPSTMPESKGGESEPSGERAYLGTRLLTVLVVGLAMIFGVLLGMHSARKRFGVQTLRPSESTDSRPGVSEPFDVQSVPDKIGNGNTLGRPGGSRQTDFRDTHRMASKPHAPGELTVFENDRVIFRLPADQDETPKVMQKRSD
jgi:hypothetical protein